MEHVETVNAVDQAIDELCQEFKTNAPFFFTEADLICRFYELVRGSLPTLFARDHDGNNHLLIHGEYPTPFRCDMGNNKFVIKDDTETKHKRGHYDIVILNPDFIGRHPYDIIKAQRYNSFKDQALAEAASYSPMIIYGIEFMFSRDPLKESRGAEKERGLEGFAAKVSQDAAKLTETRKWNERFMGNIRMLVFLKGSTPEIVHKLEGQLKRWGDVVMICSDHKMEA